MKKCVKVVINKDS